MNIEGRSRNQFIRDVILKLQDHLAGDWFIFGSRLELDPYELDVLQLNCQAHPDWRHCFRQMIFKWIDKFGSDATWTKIVDALEKMNHNRLAREVKNE